MRSAKAEASTQRAAGEKAIRIGPLYRDEQVAQFQTIKKHHVEIWTEWAKVSGMAGFAGTFWAAASLIRFAQHGGETEDDVFTRLLQAKSTLITLDLTSKAIAIFATLVVAVSVIVRTFGGEASSGIDWARRRALIVAARSLAAVAVFTATVSAVWNVSSDEWGLPAALSLIFASLIISLISADAIRVFERARSSEPGYDAWRQDLQIAILMRRIRRRRLTLAPATPGLVFSLTHRARKSALARTLVSTSMISAFIGFVLTGWLRFLSPEPWDFGRNVQAFLVVSTVWALCYSAFLLLFTATVAYRLRGQYGLVASAVFMSLYLGLFVISTILGISAKLNASSEHVLLLTVAASLMVVFPILVVALNSRLRPPSTLSRVVFGDTRTLVNSSLLRRVRDIRGQELLLRKQIERDSVLGRST